jgi:hypothetical protein
LAFEQCGADVAQADKDLGLGDLPKGAAEDTGIPVVDAAFSAYQALDTFFGSIGTFIDEKRRTEALRKFITDPKTQTQFKDNVEVLRKLSMAKDANDRSFAAQSYVMAFLKYRLVYESVVAEKLPATRVARIVKISDDLNKQVAPAIETLLDAADAYDATLELKSSDPYKALKTAFDNLTKAANDKTLSFASLAADAQSLQTVFKNATDAAGKVSSAMDAVKGKPASTTAAQ